MSIARSRHVHEPRVVVLAWISDKKRRQDALESHSHYRRRCSLRTGGRLRVTSSCVSFSYGRRRVALQRSSCCTE